MFEFKISNNEAKYEVLFSGLQLAREFQVQDLIVFNNSQLVMSQVKGSYEAQDVNIYVTEV